MRPKEIIINIINDLILPKPNFPLNTLKLAITTGIITMIGGIATILTRTLYHKYSSQSIG